MATQLTTVIQHLCGLARGDGSRMTDGELLNAFVRQRDEAALAALVERHGPMVWGVCRRLLRGQQDAEDAFQATFLVLVRKAAAVRDREAVGNWLYGVAHQTAVRVRAARAKRQRRERQVTNMPEQAADEAAVHNDLLPILDEELSRLPDKYRVLIVLCDLEGKSRKEVARQLDCPEGTVGGRLARARGMLAGRLLRRGVALPGGALATVLAQGAASAGVPAAVVSSTIKVATLVAAGNAAAGLVSVQVAALTEGVLKAMLLTKLKAAAAVILLLFGLTGLGTGLVAHRSAAAQPGPSGKDSFRTASSTSVQKRPTAFVTKTNGRRSLQLRQQVNNKKPKKPNEEGVAKAPARLDPIAAQKSAPKASEELRTLVKEFEDARNAFFGVRNKLAEQLQATKDDAKRKELQKKLKAWKDRFAVDWPMTTFGPRFLRIAEKNAKDPAGVEALDFVFREEWRLHDGVKEMSKLWGQAVAVLQKDYVAVPEVKRLMPRLAYSGDAASEQFVRAVFEKNPSRLTQARAAQALANAHELDAGFAAQLKKDKELRKQTESRLGKEAVAKRIAKGEKAGQAATELRALLKRKYADVVPDLSVGKKAPEVKCQDLEGKEVKLSDYRGKVVVLDVWTTSCIPCRAMLPGQRELVKKMKGRPFAFISISADANKETVKEFLKKEPMPWTHWWNGREVGVVEDWNIQYVPTIYVLDAKGVIRHKDHQGEFPAKKLDEAVKALLKEMGEDK